MNTNCKICSSETELWYDKQFNINYYHCNNCQFISMDDNNIVSKESEKEVYDLHNNSYENEGYLNMFRGFIDASIIPFASEGKTALDFGSGPEPVLAQLLGKEYKYKLDIYDLYYSPKKVYENNKYDLITSTEVIEHISNPLEYFELFKSLLNKDGILGLMTLFHHEDKTHFMDWHYRRDTTHISFFTPKTMDYIANKIGFTQIYNDNKRCCSFKLK